MQNRPTMVEVFRSMVALRNLGKGVHLTCKILQRHVGLMRNDFQDP